MAHLNYVRVQVGQVNEHREWQTRLGALAEAVRLQLADDHRGIHQFHYRAHKVANGKWVVECLDRSGTLGYL